MEKIFLTINETAKTGILSEYTLRLCVKQKKIPFVQLGSKVLINYPKLIEYLDKKSLETCERSQDEPMKNSEKRSL